MLHELPKVIGKKKKRSGRGPASGKGTRVGRGNKGQNSRSGGKRYIGFAGGQTRLSKKIPKLHGFINHSRIEYQVVNLNKLQAFAADTHVTKAMLRECGFIKNANKPVKILGNGELKAPLTIEADLFSQSAIEKIEKHKGKAVVLTSHT